MFKRASSMLAVALSALVAGSALAQTTFPTPQLPNRGAATGILAIKGLYASDGFEWGVDGKPFAIKCMSGCSGGGGTGGSVSDTAIAAKSLTAADTGSTTTTGQNGVPIVSGTATPAAVQAASLNGQSESVFTVKGTWAGTLQFEGSSDGGFTWSPRSAHLIGTAYQVTATSGNGTYQVNTAGLTNVRVRLSALSSGSPSVQGLTTASTGSVYLMNPARLVDNVSGNQLTIKTPANTSSTDPGATVVDAQLATLMTALNTAIGGRSDGAYGGSGDGSLIALFKGVFGQAAPSGDNGAAPPSGTKVPWFQPAIQPSNSYRLPLSAASTNAVNWATVAKKLFHIRFCNTSSSAPAVLRLYNVATTPTVGTTPIKLSVGALPGQCAAMDWPEGYSFDTGLSASLTAGDGDADTTAVAAGQVKYLNVDTN